MLDFTAWWLFRGVMSYTTSSSVLFGVSFYTRILLPSTTYSVISFLPAVSFIILCCLCCWMIGVKNSFIGSPTFLAVGLPEAVGGCTRFSVINCLVSFFCRLDFTLTFFELRRLNTSPSDELSSSTFKGLAS